MIRSRDEERRLVEAHAELAVRIARRLGYRLPGGDVEDLYQEALLALLAAVRSYREASGVPFPAFAAIVVRRRLAAAVQESLAGKHRPLNESLRSCNSEGREVAVDGFLPAATSFEQLLEAREHLGRLLAAVPRLSELERRAVFGLAAGYGRAELVGDRWKQLDNAAQRGRAKLRAA
jgi:RNA polymerase sporulation-specific sigma factor